MRKALLSEEFVAFLHKLVKEIIFFACLNVLAFNVGIEKATFEINVMYERENELNVACKLQLLLPSIILHLSSL